MWTMKVCWASEETAEEGIRRRERRQKRESKGVFGGGFMFWCGDSGGVRVEMNIRR